MILFKSPTRRRAEKMIDEINQKRTENVLARRHKTPASKEYKKLIDEDGRYMIEARVLRKLLRK